MDGLDCLGWDAVMRDYPGQKLVDYLSHAGPASIVGDDVVVIPKVGANYDDDPKTVTAVQYALVHSYGYDLGASGPNSDGVDGMYGSKTKAGVKKLQASLGYDQSGVIDENV